MYINSARSTDIFKNKTNVNGFYSQILKFQFLMTEVYYKSEKNQY